MRAWINKEIIKQKLIILNVYRHKGIALIKKNPYTYMYVQYVTIVHLSNSYSKQMGRSI